MATETKLVTTSIAVSFTVDSTDTAIFKAEVDGRPKAEGGLNNGNTSFSPGTSCWILLFKSSGVIVDEVIPSLGSLTGGVDSVTYVVEDTIQFTGEHTASLNYPIVGNFLEKIKIGDGHNCGDLTVVTGSDSQVQVPDPGEGEYVVGVYKVKYNSKGYKYQLTHSIPSEAGGGDYSIVAFFAGHKD